jgi:spoIIIJ-associated protein
VVIRVDPSRVALEPGEQLAVSSTPAAAEPPPATPPAAEPATPRIVEPEPAATVAPAPRFEPRSERLAPQPAAPSPAPVRPEPPAVFHKSVRWRQLPRSVEDGLEAQPRPARDVEESARQWLDLLLGLADLDLQATIRRSEDRLDVSLTGQDGEWLVEDDGEALQALQTLLPRLLAGDAEESLLCRVDCDGFQELREERLRLRAHQAASEVRRTGERTMLEPMMPADRRIIHVALLHDASVTTESVGRGFFKRVTIRPA